MPKFHVVCMLLFVCQVLVKSTTIAVEVTIDEDGLVADSLTNIYVNHLGSGTYVLRASDSCKDDSFSSEHVIGDIAVVNNVQPTKLIWYIPAFFADQPACIKIYNKQRNLVARSTQYHIKATSIKRKGQWDNSIFDTLKFYSGLQKNTIVAEPKDKKIGIIGAGASGLFSGFLLDLAGFHNYEILEARDRLGGRINTVYFGKPEEYRYQEMGPMRFPYANNYKNKTLLVKDHQIVFQVAEELNKRNDPKYHIKFIEWINHDDNALYYKNGIRLPNGKIPTQGDVQQNTSLMLDLGDTEREAKSAFDEIVSDEWKAKLANDIYAAHQDFLDQGYDDWSEWSYVHNKLGKSLNVSELAAEGNEAETVWGKLYDEFVMSTTQWKTIDQGLNRFAEAFGPLIGNKVKFNTKVSKLAFTKENKIAVQWKSKPFDSTYQSKTYDRVIVSAPFTMVRNWHLPKLSYTINKAIHTLGYSQACKVALEFKTRFWELSDRPIHGGYSTTDMTTKNTYYPSYQHSDAAGGRGVMLSSYLAGDMAIGLASMSQQDHVGMVLENMVELHGEQARQQFTGNYHRYCSVLDPFAAAAWADPLAGQHTLFTPSYFEMEQGLVFVGEHTDVKHAWVSAALASALRGAVMILVEAGHVDEARKLARFWNAPWLNI